MTQADPGWVSARANRLTPAVIGRVLAAGFRDWRHEPWIGSAVAALFVLGGWWIAIETTTPGRHWWIIAAMLGFPLIGPFAAVIYYEISRRRELGLTVSAEAVFGQMLAQRRRQVPYMTAMMMFVFLVWLFVAHVIFGIFLGLSAMTNISTSWQVLLSPNGLAMLAVGSLVGAAFALVIFNNTVVGLPMVVDREVDFVTAILTSWQVVLANPVTMLGWAVTVSVLLLLAMLPAFLGLLVVLPVLGHATWHLYRAALGDAEEGAGEQQPAPGR